jgi:hypothetical protein
MVSREAVAIEGSRVNSSSLPERRNRGFQSSVYAEKEVGPSTSIWR